MNPEMRSWHQFGRHSLAIWRLLRLPNEAWFSHDYSRPFISMTPGTPVPHRPDFNYTYAVPA